MKKLFIYLMLITLSAGVYAQKWVEQNSPVAKNLSKIYFVDSYVGYAIGASGIIIKTTNGGLSWVKQTSGSVYDLNDVYFINAFTGFVTGKKGTILSTRDAGKTWINISLAIDMEGGGMWFLNASKGFVAFGDGNYANSNILRTLNGGTSWDTVYSGNEWISYLYFPTSSTGYASASDGRIIRTKDGGATWQELLTGTSLWMSGIYFFDANNGFAGGGDFSSGGGKILQTSNAGDNWTTVNSSVGSSHLQFINSSVGFCVGTDSADWNIKKVMRTDDGGKTWKNLLGSSTQSFNDIFMLDENTGYAVGNNGKIYKYSKPLKLSGTVKTGGNAVNSGFLKLYEFTQQRKSLLIDSVSINVNGNYSFSDLQAGQYIIYAEADKGSYPNTAGTYYGGSNYWDSAQIINLQTQDISNAHIGIIQFNEVSGGQASLSGIVVSLDGTRAGTNPIKDVDVTLKKVPGGEMKVVSTNSLGKYSFDDMPLGNYLISISIPGLPMDSFRNVNVNNKDTVISNINFGVDSIGIHVATNVSIRELFKASVVRIYPNPAQDELFITWSNTVPKKVILFNSTGKKIRSIKTSSQQSIRLRTGDLPVGMYLIIIKEAGSLSQYKFLKM